MLLPLVVLMMTRIVNPNEAGVPSRQPQLAAAHGLVAMTYGTGSAIYFTSSTDEGRTFDRSTKVAETGALALGRHRGPRIAILKEAIVISAVVGERQSTGPHAHGLPEAGNLTAWRSTDRGKTWTRAGAINDVEGAAREGLHAMAAGPDGILYAAWLDLRAKGTQLYGSRSTDAGLTWSPNVRIYSSPDGTICQCCHPALSIDKNGRIWVMWRNVLNGSRDLYIANSADGLRFGPAQKTGTGTWKIDACPMDGGGFVIESGKLISAWRRESDVFVSEDGRAEMRIGSGKDIAIALGKQGSYIAWTKDQAIQILAPGTASPGVLANPGAFVSLVASQDGAVVAAWESNGSIETRRVD